MGKGRPIIDLTGAVFGRLTVVMLAPRDRWHGRDAYWLCDCACGSQSVVRTDKLRNGTIIGCGCLRAESGRRRASLNTTHGQSPRGAASGEYHSWHGMKQRCLNPNEPAYRYYGGRGITVCDRWRDSFAAFFEDMGPKPESSLTLDRINNDGNYEPGNCRWADKMTQTRNRRPPRKRKQLNHQFS